MMLQLLVKHCVSTEIAQQHKCSLDYSTGDTVGLKKVKIKDRHRHIVGEIYKSPLFHFKKSRDNENKGEAEGLKVAFG